MLYFQIGLTITHDMFLPAQHKSVFKGVVVTNYYSAK